MRVHVAELQGPISSAGASRSRVMLHMIPRPVRRVSGSRRTPIVDLGQSLGNRLLDGSPPSLVPTLPVCRVDSSRNRRIDSPRQQLALTEDGSSLHSAAEGALERYVMAVPRRPTHPDDDSGRLGVETPRFSPRRLSLHSSLITEHSVVRGASGAASLSVESS
jgi:hypothetical protein